MPTDTIAREFIAQIARMTKPGDLINYGGSECYRKVYDHHNTDEDVAALYRLIDEARRLTAEFEKEGR